MARGGTQPAPAFFAPGGEQPSAIAAPAAFASCPRPAAGRAPAVESWTLTAEAVDRWLRKAASGDRLVYAHGPNLIDGAVAARVRELAKLDEVLPRQRRADDGSLDYYVIRNRVRVVRARPRPPEIDDPMMAAILLKLKEVARLGLVCPTNRELGRLTGATPFQAKWCVQKLDEQKFIARRIVATPGNPRFRIVEIVATGACTAGPGSLLPGPSTPTGAGS